MDMLLRFREGLYGKIEELLRFSYEGLNNKNDEAIFRHIACLLRGDEGNDIKLLLADSDLDVNSGVKNLVDKSLIHERSNTLEMHSLVQELGKEVIRGQSNAPGKREFLVDAKDICDVLKHNTGTEKVLSIILDTDEIDEFSIHHEAFKEMPNLQYIKFYSKTWDRKKEVKRLLSRGFKYFPPKLKLLSWENYQLRHLPSHFRPEHLIKLQMWESNLEKLWDGVQPLASLKKMDMRGSKNLKEIPDLSMATNLETLCLSNCWSLVELPSSIQKLNKLQTLDMSFCTNLETLPVSINLQALDRLDLSGCSRLRSFPDISTNISELFLSKTGIEKVPWWIENFSKLKLMNMLQCRDLKYISLNIAKLKNLEKVEFSSCAALPEVSFNDTPSAEAMEKDDIHSKVPIPEETSSSLSENYFPRNENNCFNLDQEDLLQQQSVLKRLILSGEEVPSCFTHRCTGTSLTNIPLLQTSLSKPFFSFSACAVVGSENLTSSQSSFLIEVFCQFIDRQGNHFGSAYWPLYFPMASLGSHLVIFNCCLPLNGDNAYLAQRSYDHVDIQFHLTDDKSEFKIKGCGVTLSDDGKSSTGNNTHCSEESEDSDEETKRKSKRMRIT